MAKKIEFNPAIVKKYLFWVCAPIGLAVAVLAGFMAIVSVANDLDKQKKQLESQKSAIESLKSKASTHPNQKTVEAIDAEREKLEKDVLAAWTTMVEAQKEQNRWTGLATRATSDIERKNFLDTLESATLNSYLTFARGEMNKLLDKNFAQPGEPEVKLCRVQQYGLRGEPLETILLTENNSGAGSSSGSTTRTSTSPRQTTGGAVGGGFLRGKVVWDSPQLDVTMKNWTQQPLSFEVWLTQEDIWVYQALLWVVAESNKYVREASKRVATGAAGSVSTGGMAGAAGEPLNLRDSVVKQIIDIAIGTKAAMELAKQSNRRIGMSGSMGSGSSSGSSSLFGTGSEYGSSGGSGSSSDYSSSGSGSSLVMDKAALDEAAKKRAMRGRYVDDIGTPLLDADEALTGQYRRMPVYLEFVVDQRYMSDVLVNCANCPMPIDVLWVTINPDATQPFDFEVSTPSVGLAGGGSSPSPTSRGSGSISRQNTGRSSGSSGGSGSSRPVIRAPARITGMSSSGGGGSGYSTGAGTEIIGLADRSSAGSGGISSSGGSGRTGSIDFGPNAAIIQIYGCINIFAPPDPAKIKGGTAAVGGTVTGR